jgi:hypothetical protein
MKWNKAGGPMNDRTRAIKVLREAKAILSDRLTERVLDAADEILADARGDSYMNDIETVYEQVGIKLAHVNQMLSNLPVDTAAPSDKTEAKNGDRGGGPAGDQPFESSTTSNATNKTSALPGPVLGTALALPAPKRRDVSMIPANQATRPPAPTRSFQDFAAQVQTGELLEAGRSLAQLFDLEETRAIACAAVFADRLQRDPGSLRSAAQLRLEIEKGGINRAIVVLFDCFGLNAAEAIGVLQSLRRRLHLER